QAVRIENAKKRFIQCAHQRAASDERDTEAHTFFFREADNLDAERHAEAGQGVHHGNAHDDSENAIESSGVRNGIEMRADDYAASSGSSCWLEAAEISGGVNRDAHAELFHAAGKLTMNVAHGRREKRARGVTGLFSEFGQFAAQIDYLLSAVLHSRSPIGRVAVRREQKGNVIIGGRIGDAEANNNFIQKWRRIKLHFLRAMIISGAEDQFVTAGMQIVALEQWLVCAAIGIGGYRLEQKPLIATTGVETDRDSRSRFSASGVEGVSG